MSSKHLLASFLSNLELDEYIAFDLETTGLDSNKNKITEISAYRFINGEPSENFTTLVNPGESIPKDIVEQERARKEKASKL